MPCGYLRTSFIFLFFWKIINKFGFLDLSTYKNKFSCCSKGMWIRARKMSTLLLSSATHDDTSWVHNTAEAPSCNEYANVCMCMHANVIRPNYRISRTKEITARTYMWI